MKKVLVIIALGLCLAACKKEPKPVTPKYPVPEAGVAYVLEGTVATPGFTWETGSSVGLYSAMTDVKASNLECKIEGWADTGLVDPETGEPVPYTPSQYAGKATAPFNTPAMDLIQGENNFLVYTPYDPTLKFVAGVIFGLEIAEEQTQPKPDVAGKGFAFGTCKGIPGVDEKFPFTLNPVSAVAKVTVSSTEFADYGVKKVTIWDESKQAKLGGGFNVNIETNEFQTLTSYDRVSTTVSNPSTLGTKSQSVYVNVLPGTFSDLYIIVELTGAKGNVTIPIKKSGLSFTGGQTTEITVSDLKSADNGFAWYCPVESRLQSGLGYAYGDANTYLIQCKNGSTWHGATYQANADIPDEVVIDYRARGSFFAVEPPVDVTFEWFENNGNTYVPRTMQYDESGIDPTQYTITQNAAEFKVTVKNTGAYAGAPILLMKKGERVLWAWAFWNIAADGTALTPVSVGGKQLANMDIGQPTTQYTKWIANSAYNNYGKDNQSRVAPDVIFRFNHYYQFGRTVPVFWTSYWTFTWDPISPNYSGTGNCVGIEGPIDLATAIAHPVGMVLAYPDPTDMPSWCSEGGKRGDLWGGNIHADDTAEGSKSIYDPCPKGWRVPDPSVLSALKDAAESATYENTAGIVGFYLDGALFYTNGYGNGKLAGNGRLASMGMGQNGTTGSCSHGMVWSNYIGGHNLNQPVSFYWRNEGNKSGNRAGKYNSSVSASVRCQKDEANR